MSRGFVKDGDIEDVPIVPPRAYLPPGIENYVTPYGLELLQREREQLIVERESHSHGTEADIRVARNFINAKLALLEERIRTANVVNADGDASDVVAFGCIFRLRIDGGNPMTMQIVGVDEADASQGKISFLSPMARVLIGLHRGTRTTVKLPIAIREVEIL